MSGYSPEIEQAGITWGQLKKCRDDDYVCTMVSAFMLVQVLDNLQVHVSLYFMVTCL